MAAALRWGAVRSVAREVRAASRPGSPSFGARMVAVPRMVRSVLRGEYRELPVQRLLLLGLGLVYVVSPVDLVPEMLVPLLGVGDDAAVIALVAAALSRETESFLHWERIARDTVPSTVVNWG